jgi:hypothetical protein
MDIVYLEQDRRHYAACPVMPEFALSPKGKHEPMAPIARPTSDNRWQGPMLPSHRFNPRHIGMRSKRITQQEADWRSLKPNEKFKPVNEDGFVVTIGKTKPWIPESFASREAEYNWLIATQDTELEFHDEMFRTNGLKSSSLDDDDRADIIDHDAARYGTVFSVGKRSLEEAAPFIRRIEFERIAAQASQPDCVRLTAIGDEIHPVSRWPMDDEKLQEMGAQLYAALGYPSVEQVATMERERFYYGYTGSILYGVRAGDPLPEQPQEDNLQLMADELTPAEEVLQGPQELGLHNFSDDEMPLVIGGRVISTGRTLSEPNESDEERWAFDYPPVLYGVRPIGF